MNNLLSLAYYLPQFHQIPENDQWWGEGFTEWTHLRKARKYRNWQQIRKPIQPFYEYSLLDREVLEWQAEQATSHGVTGFFIWDYWFGGGERLLESPSNLLLNGSPAFPYCFSWANHSWFNKKTGTLLKEQKYLGSQDYAAYFYKNLPHFQKINYLKVDGRPIFGIFAPKEVPDLGVFIETFQHLAIKEGFPGIFFIADNTVSNSSTYLNLFDRHLDSAGAFRRRRLASPFNYIKEQLIRRLNLNFLGPIVYDYRRTIVEHSRQAVLAAKEVPVLFTGWDTTARHKERGTIYRGFNQKLFRENLQLIRRQLANQANDQPILVIKSWNEWAEGNVMEPDDLLQDALLKTYENSMNSPLGHHDLMK